MNLPRFRQLCQGNFLDIIFSCPYELHELTANRFLSKLFFTLSDEQKEVLYYLFVKQYSTCLLYTSRYDFPQYGQNVCKGFQSLYLIQRCRKQPL